eukprot:scaffold19337_cov128-Isochrysis_galbana.AAC.5
MACLGPSTGAARGRLPDSRGGARCAERRMALERLVLAFDRIHAPPPRRAEPPHAQRPGLSGRSASSW